MSDRFASAAEVLRLVEQKENERIDAHFKEQREALRDMHAQAFSPTPTANNTFFGYDQLTGVSAKGKEVAGLNLEAGSQEHGEEDAPHIEPRHGSFPPPPMGTGASGSPAGKKI